VPEIFALKALVSADRSKSRDWFDLYTLFKEHGYTWANYHEIFQKMSTDFQYRNAASRLCSGEPQPDDEGYQSLVDNAPSLTEMRDYFTALCTAFEGNQPD